MKKLMAISRVIPLLITLLLAVVHHGNAISCQQIQTALAPCVPYLLKGGNPSSQCCSGLKNIKAAAKTKADRQAACKCLKEAASKYPGVKDENASNLPKKCGLDFGVPFTRKTDCNSVK